MTAVVRAKKMTAAMTKRFASTGAFNPLDMAWVVRAAPLSPLSQLPVIKIAKACVPFLIAFLIALVLISYIPQLSLLLTGI